MIGRVPDKFRLRIRLRAGGVQERHFDWRWTGRHGRYSYVGNWKIRTLSIILARFWVTTEDLRFCEVWPGDGYGLIRNATGWDSNDGALTFYDRFRVTEILEEVLSIFGYFWFGTSAYLHWKLPYCTSLFFRTDFTVAWVFQKRSTLTILLPRLEFGRRSLCLRKFGTLYLKILSIGEFSRGTRPLFPLFSISFGLIWVLVWWAHQPSPSSLSLSLLSFSLAMPPTTTAGAPRRCPTYQTSRRG